MNKNFEYKKLFSYEVKLSVAVKCFLYMFKQESSQVKIEVFVGQKCHCSISDLLERHFTS